MVTGIIDLAAICCGGYHGYCDAQKIPLQENTEWTLTYAPTMVQGGLAGLVGAALGLTIGGAAGSTYGAIGVLVGGAGCGMFLGTVGLAIGTAVGGLETVIGYGMGYGIGSLAPKSQDITDKNSNL